MITKMSIILFLNFVWSYPLFLWLTPEIELKKDFFRFNLGLSIIVGFCALFISFFKSSLDLLGFISLPIFICNISWLGILFLLTWYFWNKGKFPMSIITCISTFGLFIASWIIKDILLYQSNIGGFIIGAMALSSVIFTMILGHWYLNVPGLSIYFIRRSVVILGIILFIRLIWNFWLINFTTINQEFTGEIPIIYYLQTFDGIFLWIAILFGLIGAIIINILTYKTVKIHSIQSATGLLYVNLVVILMAEMIFKYYMIHIGLIL